MNDTIYTIIPPIVAILVAVWRKSAIQALIVGIVLTYLMTAHFSLGLSTLINVFRNGRGVRAEPIISALVF